MYEASPRYPSTRSNVSTYSPRPPKRVASMVYVPGVRFPYSATAQTSIRLVTVSS